MTGTAYGSRLSPGRHTLVGAANRRYFIRLNRTLLPSACRVAM
jgi:hypothetical protein